MRSIDADVLLEKVREIRKLALDRAAETPANMPFPIYQSPAYIRYSTQAIEREKFKVMIEEAPSVQPEQRWIPVSERLPEVGKGVLLTTTFPTLVIGWLKSDGKWLIYENDGNSFQDYITAWMPLPEPYREGERE